tara:strand:+ start:14669 stop:15655 length:987 start_codon:yes stop_codon:yes gene_type:complete
VKVLITGGAGFIGSHCVDIFLKNGYEVVVVDNLVGGRIENIEHNAANKNFNFYEKDINDLTIDEKFLDGVEYIVHFAGIGDIVPSIEDPYKYIYTNVLGTVNMLNIANKLNVKKFVYAASSSCYGIAQTPTSENSPILLEYPYALSKFQGEEACFHWAKVYGLNVNSIRIFNAYGTRSRTSGAYGAVMGVFLKQKIEKKPFTLVGDGNQKRDFVYVTDVANAFYLASTTAHSNEIFNVGAAQPQTINKLIELLGGGDIERLPKRTGEPEITHADIGKIKKMLKWEPKVSFEKGISLILENISYWKNAPLWNKKSIDDATKTWHQFMDK